MKKFILILVLTTFLSSCRSHPSPADYFDLWFVTPKNPFHEDALTLTDQTAAD